MEKVRFVVDQYGIIYALMPNGTYQKVLVNVHESAWYGYLSIEREIEPKEET